MLYFVDVFETMSREDYASYGYVTRLASFLASRGITKTC